MRCDGGEIISPLLSSCLGPRGRPKLLSPSSVLSSSSKRIIPLLHSRTSPLARIVLKAAKTHLSSHGDGGLVCAVLALWLARHPPQMEFLPRVGLLYENFSREFLFILQTEVAVDVDFGSVRDLRCVVRTLLSSKPGCCLCRSDVDVVCCLVLRAFLDAAPGAVGVSSGLGLTPAHSRMVEGVAVKLQKGEAERIRRRLPAGDGPFCACLFTRSLAGDMDWPAHSLSTTSKDAVEQASLQHIFSVVEEALDEGVVILLCQKVAHPRLQKRLQAKRVVVVDRLGGENASRVRRMWGDRDGSCDGVWFGSLCRPRVECVGRSHFLVLNSRDAPRLRTLLLTHHNQEALAELEVVCRQSLSALFRLLGRPRVCFGGGCGEITAALLLLRKVRARLESICRETGSTPEYVLCSLESFVRGIAHLCASIHQAAPTDFATDSEGGHLWQQRLPADRCACGSRDASSVKTWRPLTDMAGLADILLSSVPGSTSFVSDSSSTSLPACASSDGLIPSQNDLASCHVPQIVQTLRLNASASISEAQLSTSLSQNALKVINPSSLDNLPGSAGREFLLDELGCKLSSLSLAFETSSLLLKTTECIHTSPQASVEQTKADDDYVFY